VLAVRGILKPEETVGVKVTVLVEVEIVKPMPVAVPVAKV
jgi:hypothetical protein